MDLVSLPWIYLLIDFIIKLPLSKFYNKVYNAILIVVDRYIKIARYIPYIKKIFALELTKYFLEYIVQYFGLLASIVSDRGPQFISNF